MGLPQAGQDEGQVIAVDDENRSAKGPKPDRNPCPVQVIKQCLRLEVLDASPEGEVGSQVVRRMEPKMLLEQTAVGTPGRLA